MSHKPVIREYATTTKVRMVFDASAKPNPLANSINDCMYTGPPLIRVHMSTHILLADIQKAFLQIGIQEENRDAFLFPVQYQRHGTTSPVCRSNNIFGVPFGVEASPFMLGNDQQPLELHETVKELRENTYVNNLMKSGNNLENYKSLSEKPVTDTDISQRTPYQGFSVTGYIVNR